MAKAESRTELMARVFAETGMKRLFRGLYNLVIRHQDYPRLVRMRGAYVEVDPTNWPADPDVSVRVGIGAGTRNEQLQSIAAIIAKQEMVLQTLGLSDNPLVDLRQYRNALAEAVKLSGRQDPSRFWKEITPEDLEAREQQAQQAAQEQGQNDPALVLAQAQVEQEKLKNQIDQLKLQIEHQHKSASLELQREQMIRLDDRERDRMEADIALRAREIELKYQGAVDVASIKAEMERDRETLRAETALANTALGLPEEQALEQEPLQEDVPTDFPSDGAIL